MEKKIKKELHEIWLIHKIPLLINDIITTCEKIQLFLHKIMIIILYFS